MSSRVSIHRWELKRSGLVFGLTTHTRWGPGFESSTVRRKIADRHLGVMTGVWPTPLVSEVMGWNTCYEGGSSLKTLLLFGFPVSFFIRRIRTNKSENFFCRRLFQAYAEASDNLCFLVFLWGYLEGMVVLTIVELATEIRMFSFARIVHFVSLCMNWMKTESKCLVFLLCYDELSDTRSDIFFFVVVFWVSNSVYSLIANKWLKSLRW